MEPGDLQGLGDVLLDCEAGEDEIRSALCCLFSLMPGQVTVVEGGVELCGQDTEEVVFCGIHRLAGEFPILLSLWEGASAGLPRIPTAARLCQLLGCRCLVSDGSVNPYTYLLVDECGQARRVAVDVDRWDRNESVIDTNWPMQ